MPVARYFVKNSNTLGFTYDEQPGVFNVLHGSVLLGGDDWKNGFVAIGSTDVLVPATVEDFHKFRVRPEGHL